MRSGGARVWFITLDLDRQINEMRMIGGMGMNARVHSYLMKFMYKRILYIKWGGFNKI